MTGCAEADRLTLAAVPTAVRCARMFVRITLQNWQASEETVETAELLASELVSNAVKVTGVVEQLPISSDAYRHLSLIEIRLMTFERSVVIEVWDTDSDPPVLQEQLLGAEDGRGLSIVATMSRRWSYYVPPNGGKVVWCEFDLMPAPAENATIDLARPLPNRKRYAGPVYPAQAMNDPAVLREVLEGLHALDGEREE